MNVVINAPFLATEGNNRTAIHSGISNVLRKYREGRGFTQDEFATYCGLSRAYYGRVERGEHSLTIEKCQKIATTLNVRLADLFGELQE